jgi:hypothetical protein
MAKPGGVVGAAVNADARGDPLHRLGEPIVVDAEKSLRVEG